MEGDRHKQRKGYSGNTILLAILAGFCILAIIEIIYGQAQIRMERERLALEEANNQAVQELREEWDGLKGETSGNAAPEMEAGTNAGDSAVIRTEKQLTDTEDEQTQATVSENSDEADQGEYDMQIVFMGDSILDNERSGTGVAALVGEACNAKIYNMAIGGTTAAILYDESRDFNSWSSMGLMGMLNAILGNIDPSFFDGYEAAEILRECDFSKTDYFIIEYGINDFTCGKVPQSKYIDGTEVDLASVCTYSGALEMAVIALRSNFPNAKIMIVPPHYCQFFSGEQFLGDAYSINYGYGTLVDFYNAAKYVAEKYRDDDVLFFDTMEQSNIDAYTADQYLEDGIHLSEEGRRQYASCLARWIRADFYPEE